MELDSVPRLDSPHLSPYHGCIEWPNDMDKTKAHRSVNTYFTALHT